MDRRLLAPLLIGLLATGMITSSSAAQDTNPWLARRVLAIAHAGGEDEAPHETMYAYKRAAGLGIEVLEGDVRLTGDDVLVVHHDDTVDATTNGTGRVDDQTYDELFALDHGYKFTLDRWSCGDCPEEDYVFRGVRTGAVAAPVGYTEDDFAIPTAESLFTTFPNLFLDLEIKETGEAGRHAADALIDLVKAQDAVDRVIFVSFDDEIVQYVRDNFPEATTSPGLAAVTDFYLNRLPQPDHAILQVPPTYTGIQVVDQQFVDDAHAAGLAVWVWMDTKEQESDAFYQQLIDWGVDGILGSRPSVARTVIDRSGLRWQGEDPTDPTTPTTPASGAGSPSSVDDATVQGANTNASASPRFTG